MSISFSGSELVNIAIGIERRGIAFYDIMTKSTKNAATRFDETFSTRYNKSESEAVENLG